ncbi:PAS domain S-box protein [Thermosulfurimonas sp. F29]|uniref:PAS domain-containing hybrid sensor histidine kinase/response regulator n=1 Tax=Thermosulfurimonas sp. F29 TaxID=2867247 RepID=UPI001C831F12|nr:PAS domain S-box protein [Thermosulfurimonas sp. F29]MBX6422533.1 PAS domain S-box protein [Thermosulfurimonas sp. F29]
MKNCFDPRVLDLLPDGVMVLDAEGRILYANSAMAEILRKPLPEILGGYCYKLVHGTETRPSFCVQMRMEAEMRPIVEEFYEPHLGTWLWVYAAPVKNEKGCCVACFHLTRNISREEKGFVGNYLFARIVETLPGFFYLSDRNYRILAANRRFKEWVGKDPTGRLCYEVIYGRKVPCDWCRQDEVFEEGKALQWEARNPRDHRWYLAVNSPFDSPSGERFKIGLIFDIHERKILEEKLFRLFEDNPAGLAVTDFEGRILMVNRALRALMGIEEKALQGKTVWEYYLQPEDRHHFMKTLKRKGEISGYELQLRDHRGRIRTVLVSARVFGEGEHREIWSTVQDITALKEAEAALAESEARFRTLAENAPLAVILMDDVGRITYFNPMAERIFGWMEREVLGKELHLVLAPPKYHQRYREAFARVRATGKSRLFGKRLEFEALRKDGSVFPAEVFFSIIEVRGRRLYLGLVQDISERKRLEEERLKLEKHRALELLAGGVAHDFNNLLTSILGNLDLLERLVENGKAREIIERSRKVAREARDLARDLLIFSKGDIPIPKEVVIRDFLKDLVRFLTHGSPVRVHFEIPPGLPPIKIDSSHFAQMVQNLVLNALEAMPEGGDLFIQAEAVEERVILTVRDTGPGIPPEILPQIFEPGFTTKRAGSGLGLAVVKSIVERYGGSIEVFSPPGEGAMFRIVLPASKTEPLVRLSREFPSFKGKEKFSGRVLVMDDEEPIRTLLFEALSHLGVEVETAASGEEALHKYRRALEEGKPFDLLILDLTVPGGKGAIWVAERLREETGPRPRLVLSTGYALEVFRDRDLAAPFDDVLKKPYTLEELSNLLRKHLAS